MTSDIVADLAPPQVESEGESVFARPTHEPRAPLTRRQHFERWTEILGVVILGIATLGTAWSGYQSTRWSGVQAGDYAVAGSRRVESTKAASLANTQTVVDVSAFTSWVNAYAAHNTTLADFYAKRFRDEFKPAFAAWLATDPKNNPQAPPTPFAMPQYVLQATQQADRLDKQAAALLVQGDNANEVGDKYVLNTVFLAAVMFFAAVAQGFEWLGPRVGLLGLGFVMLIIGIANIIRYPIT